MPQCVAHFHFFLIFIQLLTIAYTYLVSISVVTAVIPSTEGEQIHKGVKIPFRAADSHCWEIMQLKWKIIHLPAPKSKTETDRYQAVAGRYSMSELRREKKINLMSEETKNTTNNIKNQNYRFTLFLFPPALRLRRWRERRELLTLNRRIVPLSGISAVHLRVDPEAQSPKLAEKQRRQAGSSAGLAQRSAITFDTVI